MFTYQTQYYIFIIIFSYYSLKCIKSLYRWIIIITLPKSIFVMKPFHILKWINTLLITYLIDCQLKYIFSNAWLSRNVGSLN